MPLPVPPEMTMFFLARTQRWRKRPICGVKAPNWVSLSRVRGTLANFRMVMQDPRRAMGRITAFTREPSLRRASTMGEDSSMRRPRGVTIRSITARTRSSSVKRASVLVSLPPRST